MTGVTQNRAPYRGRSEQMRGEAVWGARAAALAAGGSLFPPLPPHFPQWLKLWGAVVQSTRHDKMAVWVDNSSLSVPTDGP